MGNKKHTNLSAQERLIKESIAEAKSQRNYKVAEIKNWCDTNLTPIAWEKILLQVRPITKEYGYDLYEMNKPTLETVIEYDFFLLLKATILELYGKDIESK